MSICKIDVDQTNRELESATAFEIMQWAVNTYGQRLALQSSMQKTAGVLMHMISQIAPETEIVFIDTDVHFKETLETRDQFQRRFNLNIQTYKPLRTFEEQYSDFGRHLYLTDDSVPGNPPGYRQCCILRKEEPFIRAVKGRFDAVIGGLMRSEGGARSDVKILTPDPRIDALKIYPLARWSDQDVDCYTAEHDLPVHPLYARGFTSIGCFTCTTPIAPGEDKRAGRWRHIREGNPELQATPLYCGINIEDKKNT